VLNGGDSIQRKHKEVKMAKNETKQDKFKRIATRRVRNAIKMVERIGKLSSYGYEYTDEDVEKIINALEEALNKLKASFSTKESKVSEFEL